MQIRRKLATAAATAMMVTFVSANAATVNTVNYTHEHPYTPVYGKTLPPIGYVNFCARNASECRSMRPATNAQTTIDLTPKRWSELKQINLFVNAHITPVSDQEQYNVPEHWGYPSGAGDCEDYVLLKKRYLEGLGFPAESLLITVVLDEVGDGHAVLTARTNAGDYILDNRRDTIQRWSETRYQFLKRQSQEDPTVWMALTNKERRRSTSVISGGS
jgi:predicted transglutaminase-like cysteine proteinase